MAFMMTWMRYPSSKVAPYGATLRLFATQSMK